MLLTHLGPGVHGSAPVQQEAADGGVAPPGGEVERGGAQCPGGGSLWKGTGEADLTW